MEGGEAALAHAALHRFHMLPDYLLNLPIRVRVFVYGSLILQAEKRQELAENLGNEMEE